jgi:hypothetical protein
MQKQRRKVNNNVTCTPLEGADSALIPAKYYRWMLPGSVFLVACSLLLNFIANKRHCRFYNLIFATPYGLSMAHQNVPSESSIFPSP